MFTSQANCDSNTGGVTGTLTNTGTIPVTTTSTTIWISNINSPTAWVGASQFSGTPTPQLMPAKWVN